MLRNAAPMNNRGISSDVKLAIVMDILRGKEPIEAVCARHKVDVTDALVWRDEFLEGGKEALDKRRLKAMRSALLKENTKLRKLVAKKIEDIKFHKEIVQIIEGAKKRQATTPAVTHGGMVNETSSATGKSAHGTAGEDAAYPVYQIKVSLKEIQPEIWRRILVPGNTSLCALHEIIQAAFGWQNRHLHRFAIGKTRYTDPNFEPSGSEVEENEYAFRLCDVVHDENIVFAYIYDYGDNWEHIVHVEKITKDDKSGLTRATCIAGERASPPEDCGGPYEYGEFLEAIKNPAHERHAELIEWLGKPFSPETLDKDKINRKLRRLVMNPQRRRHGEAF